MQRNGIEQSARKSTVADSSEGTLCLLVASIARGDQVALAALFDQSFDRVFQIARRFVRNDADAEEVAVEVFHQVWRSAATFDPARGSVWSWLAARAWSRAVDRLRQQRLGDGGPNLHLDYNDAAYMNCEDPVQTRWFEALDANCSLRAVIDCLTAAQRLVIGLAYFEGLSQTEIAERTGLALGTVKSHLRRGLESLRVRLVSGEVGTRGAAVEPLARNGVPEPG